MRWGFNWEFGPFELWQELGVEEISERIRQDGKVLPEWVEELQKQESKCFYRVESDHQEFFDLGAREYRVLSEDPEKIQLTLLKKQDKVIRSKA